MISCKAVASFSFLLNCALSKALAGFRTFAFSEHMYFTYCVYTVNVHIVQSLMVVLQYLVCVLC